MLHRVFGSLEGMALAAHDGEIGRIRDVYFDDAEWICRYLVVDTGGWLSGRRVLISPHALQGIDLVQSVVRVRLTREQVRRSPDIDTDKPVSRQQETAYYDYYGLAYYWTDAYVWGRASNVGPIERVTTDTATKAQREMHDREREEHDPHLRSAKEVSGYKIAATDESLGEVDDLLLAEEDWRVRYLVVDTRKWLLGKHVLIGVDWVRRVSWPERAVFVDMSTQSVRNSPEYDPAAPVTSEAEARLYAHYGRDLPNVRGLR